MTKRQKAKLYTFGSEKTLRGGLRRRLWIAGSDCIDWRQDISRAGLRTKEKPVPELDGHRNQQKVPLDISDEAAPNQTAII